MTSALIGKVDLGDVAQNILDRLSAMEQKITSPTYVVPNGSSPAFGTVAIGSSGKPLSDLVSPPTALILNAGAIFDNIYVKVDWTAPVDGSAGTYLVQIAKKNIAAGTYALTNQIYVSGTETYIYGLEPNTTYGVKVYSVSYIGVPSSVSLPASGWTDVATTQDSSIPAAPIGLSVITGMNSLTVLWNDNTELDVKQGNGIYELQYDTNSSFTAPTTVLTSATITSITGLSSTTTYWFRLRARDSSGNPGPYCTAVSRVPGAVVAAASDGAAPTTAPTVAVQNGTAALIIKVTPITNPDPVKYEVYMSTTTGFTPGAGNLVATDPGTNIIILKDAAGASLVYGTTYYIKVRAVDADGGGPYSTQTSGSPLQVGTNDLAIGSITAASGIIGSLDASKITTGSMSATYLTAGTLTSDRVVTAGLDAGVIKFGTMSGDRITANTLDVGAIKTSVLTTTVLTMGSGGLIVGGSNPTGVGPAQSGYVIGSSGFTAYVGGAITFQIQSNGSAFFKGDITGASGTFSGTLTGNTINGATIIGANITATPVPVGWSVHNLVSNAGFESYDASGAFMNWNYALTPGGTLVGIGPSVSTGTGWSVGRELTSPMSGGVSFSIVTTDATSGTLVQSDLIPIQGGENLVLRADFMQPQTLHRPILIGLTWFDKNGTALATTGAAPSDAAVYNVDGSATGATIASSASAGVSYIASNYMVASVAAKRVAGTLLAPATAAYCRVVLGQWSGGSTGTCQTRFDNISLVRSQENAQVNGGTITGSTIQTGLTGARIVMQPTNGTYSGSGFYQGGLQMFGNTALDRPGRIQAADYSDNAGATISAMAIFGGRKKSTDSTAENYMAVYPRNSSDDGGANMTNGISMQVNGSYWHFFGGTSAAYFTTVTGGAGLKVAAGAVFAVDYTGTAYAQFYSNGAAVPSDENTKHMLTDPQESSLALLRKVKIKEFRYKTDNHTPAHVRRLGLMAGDLPDRFRITTPGNPTSVDIMTMVGIGHHAITEVDDKVEAYHDLVRTKHNQLVQQVEDLKAQVAALSK